MELLTAYFSAEGNTEKFAEALAQAMNTELFAILPETPYTKSDLNWKNPLARCNREKIGRKDVPVQEFPENWDAYDTVFLGFPIWYRTYPRVVATFLESYDFSGKIVYPFCTNDEGTFGISLLEMQGVLKGAEITDGLAIRGVDVNDSDGRSRSFVGLL